MMCFVLVTWHGGPCDMCAQVSKETGQRRRCSCGRSGARYRRSLMGLCECVVMSRCTSKSIHSRSLDGVCSAEQLSLTWLGCRQCILHRVILGIGDLQSISSRLSPWTGDAYLEYPPRVVSIIRETTVAHTFRGHDGLIEMAVE